MKEREFIARVRSLGGRVYLVGGAVRDQLRGVESKDRDYCLTGVDEDRFLECFEDVQRVGHAFPVFLIRINGRLSEVAFARRERKIGRGYRGFDVKFDPTVSIEEDLYRRDTTINAMAIELPSGVLIDPFDGRADVESRTIRAVSEHFVEDPVRALRAARQSAEFQYEITDETILAMHECGRELSDEPGERIVYELNRALQTERPSLFFRALERAGLLEITFPELHRMIGKTQPSLYHPEGDAFEHTMKIVDDVARVNEDVAVRFCALAHDLGKGVTPSEMLPHHYGHDLRGLEVLQEWSERTTLPRNWMKAAQLVIEEHMRAPVITHPGKIVDLLMKVQASRLSFGDFNDIIRADNLGRLPFHLEHGEEIVARFFSIDARNRPPELVGEQIGAWLRGERIKIYLTYKQQQEG